MARSINDIYDEIITEKETMASLTSLTPDPDDSQTFLADLTSTSKVAIWRLLAWLMAVAINAHESLWDAFKIEVERLAAEKETGTIRWYQLQCFNYQHGDSLVWSDKLQKFVYAVIDPTKQIIKRAAAIDNTGIVSIKVAKLTAGVPDKLTSGELAGFTTYIDQVKFAGTFVNVISQDADLLKLTYTVYYDPLVMDTDGSLLTDGATFPVEDAINAYIQELPFNGILNVTELTDKIQAAAGVVDPVFTTAEGKPSTGVYAAFTENYQTDAGHSKIDPANPLTGTITYTSV